MCTVHAVKLGPVANDSITRFLRFRFAHDTCKRNVGLPCVDCQYLLRYDNQWAGDSIVCTWLCNPSTIVAIETCWRIMWAICIVGGSSALISTSVADQSHENDISWQRVRSRTSADSGLRGGCTKSRTKNIAAVSWWERQTFSTSYQSSRIALRTATDDKHTWWAISADHTLQTDVSHYDQPTLSYHIAPTIVVS